jgi:hypothetical protein
LKFWPEFCIISFLSYKNINITKLCGFFSNKAAQMKKLLIGSALSLMAFAGSAQATIIQYSTLASFNTATGGSSTLETFDSATAGLLTVGVERLFNGFGFSYTNSAGGNQRAGIYTAAQINQNSGTAINNTNSVGWGEWVNGVYTDGRDGPNVVFRFFSPITSFAFDFSDSDPTDSYSVQFGNETPFALRVASNATTFTNFFGFVSSNPFTTVTFRQTATGGATETFSIDNIRTNGFRTPEEAAAVSAPSTLAILGLGLIALVGRRKKTV